jgi:predicted Zn-dependent protease with MMP-like domain
VQSGYQGVPGHGAPIRRRDRHGRGLRGVLAPPDVPLHRTRAQRFDDLVLQAVTRLEARWEEELAGIEFGVEEIPPGTVIEGSGAPGPVPLGRLDPGSARDHGGPPADQPGGLRHEVLVGPEGDESTDGDEPAADPHRPRPPRIVVYRRPLMARADGEEELSELVFGVVVEEFARLLGLDPEDIDPGYPGGE